MCKNVVYQIAAASEILAATQDARCRHSLKLFQLVKANIKRMWPDHCIVTVVADCTSLPGP